MVVNGETNGQETAVLASGGLDSIVLVAHEAQTAIVQPIYVRVGLAWEAQEIDRLDRVMRAPPFTRSVRPVIRLDAPMRDVYSASHWAVRGTPPAYDTPDEDVYLVGRNVTLLSKAGVFCATRGIHRLAIGPLKGNPFPDATPQFFAAMAHTLSVGLAHTIEIAAPFSTFEKHEVIARGRALGVPFELTLSCMNPQDGRHCGQCSKCRERIDAFREAGCADAAEYATKVER